MYEQPLDCIHVKIIMHGSIAHGIVLKLAKCNCSAIRLPMLEHASSHAMHTVHA